MERLLAATSNAGKLVEIRRLLEGFEVLSLADLPEEARAMPEETGSTFALNAVLKAVTISRRTAHPVVADDSGLCIDHLGGRPGILSARHGGEGLSDRERYELVLAEMQGVPDVLRGAHYAAAVALARAGRLLSLHEGTCSGRILREPRGSGGFGYDPIFLVAAHGKSMAELTPAEKDAVSHRARAIAGLREALRGGVLLG